jgi:hypothetical protein
MISECSTGAAVSTSKGVVISALYSVHQLNKFHEHLKQCLFSIISMDVTHPRVLDAEETGSTFP